MEGVSSDLLRLLYALLPGFVAAWVFYGLTAHPKISSFERVVQALIFTAIVQAITAALQFVLLALGNIVAFGIWSDELRLLWSVLLALCLGLLFACYANSDRLHGWMRRHHITSRTSFPSEWFSAFCRQRRWVVLHLSGGRRLYGWPEEWPDQPDSGHFLIDQPEWLLDDGTRAPVHRVANLLIPATAVEMVEFLKCPEEVLAQPEELKRADSTLIELQSKENDHGKQSSSASPESTSGS